MIGNAVPVNLAYEIANAILAALSKNKQIATRTSNLKAKHGKDAKSRTLNEQEVCDVCA